MSPALVLWIALLLALAPFTSFAAQATAGSGGAGSTTELPLPLEASYIVLRLLPGRPDAKDYNVGAMSDTGRVLLVRAPGGFPENHSGATVGIRWDQGEVDELKAPEAPWIYDGASSNYTLTYQASDMNDSGFAIGVAHFTGHYSVDDEELPFSESLVIQWSPDAGDAPVALPTGLDGVLNRAEQKYRFAASANSNVGPYIDATGQIYATASVSRPFTSSPYESEHLAYGDVIVWQNASAAWTRVTDNFSTKPDKTSTVDYSPGGNVIYQRRTEEIYEYIVGSRTFHGGQLSQQQGLWPSVINDEGRVVGFDHTTGKIAWATASEGPHSLEGLFVSPTNGINSRNDILGGGLSGKRKLWKWVVDSAGTGSYVDHLIKVDIPSTHVVGAFRLSGQGVIGGPLAKVLDEQGNALPHELTEREPVLLVPGELAVDGNRDGVIISSHYVTQSSDVDSVTPENPYYFASNDDDDIDPNAITETTGTDWQNSRVDGPDDLADFFPVFLDIKQLLAVLPPSAPRAPTAGRIVYKLKQANGGLNFVYTSLTRETAFDYQDASTATTGYGPNQDKAAYEAPTHQISAAGVDLFELDPDLVARIKDEDQGVILIEMRGMTAEPLKLVVEKDNVQIAEVAVNIATGEVKFEALPGNAPLSENRNPGTDDWMPGKGLRIFPDALNNTDTTHRNRVFVKVRVAGATGNAILRIIDVDDPSPSQTTEDPDYNHLVDPNDATGEKGDDNYGDVDNNGDIIPGKAALFTNNQQDQVTCTIDSDGYARIGGQYPEMTVSKRPGDNYRIAVAFKEWDLDILQVLDSDEVGYVPSGSRHPERFSGLCSDMLTVWRKVHVEQDTMSNVPTSGPEKNIETGLIDSITPLSGGVVKLNLNVSLPGESNRFEKGIMTINGVDFVIVSSESNLFAGDDVVVNDSPAGDLLAWHAAGTTGQAFSIRDDDDQFLPAHAVLPVPATDNYITPYVLKKYAPAYIELGATQPNAEPVIDFKLYLRPPHSSSRNLTDRSDFWAIRLICAYQPTVGDEADPNLGSAPITGEYRGCDACVFLESIREENRSALSVPSSPMGNASYIIDKDANVAHEIGHAPNPGFLAFRNDHIEGGLMAAGIGEGPDASFSSATILRFRTTKTWSN